MEELEHEPAREAAGAAGAAPRHGPAEHEFEAYPLTRQEYINAVIHFYRGELARSTAWRARIDQTTYWAIALMAGIFSFSFGSKDSPHTSLLFGNLIILLLLTFEARRYRRYDAWYARVRMIEENFYIPILRRDLVSPMSQWRQRVAEDLMTPRYKITVPAAIGIRLVRNYIWLFLVELLGWMIKLVTHPEPAHALREVYARMHVGFVPSWLVLASVVAFYGAAIAFAWHHRGLSADREMRSEMVQEGLREWKQL